MARARTEAAGTDPLDAGRMTIWEHLAELRSRLIKALLAVGFGALVAWFLWDPVLTFLTSPYEELVGDQGLVATDPLQPFATRIKVSAYLGIIIAMPVILWQVWRFVTPGLYPHEKRYAVPFVASALLLFLLGAGIAYYTLNAALQFLISVGGDSIEPFYTADAYITLIVYMMLAFGVGMEFPVLLVALQIAGVLTPRRLLGWWRQAVVLIGIIAAVITPSGDPISMMALMTPMVVFYFVAIGIGALVARRRRRVTAAAPV